MNLEELPVYDKGERSDSTIYFNPIENCHSNSSREKQKYILELLVKKVVPSLQPLLEK